MTTRPDHLLLSLGPNRDEHKASLTALAADLDISGQRGPSIGLLMVWLAETYDSAASETVELLNIAGHVAAGGCIEEWLKMRWEVQTMKKPNRDEIVDRVGANNWRQVKREYKGKNRGEIVANMYYMWPDESKANEELATAIYDELN